LTAWLVCATWLLVAGLALSKPGNGNGGGNDDGGGTPPPPRVGSLYYWVGWDLWRAAADGLTPPELVGPNARLSVSNHEIAISNYLYGPNQDFRWFVAMRESPRKYVAFNDGVPRQIDVHEMYAFQYYRDSNGEQRESEPIQLTDTYGSVYWFTGDHLYWDKTGNDAFLTYQAYDISQRLTPDTYDGMIVLDTTQPLRQVIVKVPVPAASIQPGMAPLFGNSFVEACHLASFNNGVWTRITDPTWAELDPFLELLAGGDPVEGRAIMDFFAAPAGNYVFSGPEAGTPVEWSFDGNRVMHSGMTMLSIDRDNQTTFDSVRLASSGQQKGGTDVLLVHEPRFSPDGNYVMYRSREKSKGSTTNYIRMVSTDGDYNFVVDTDGDPLRWVSDLVAP
jgi:hypothetical protein